MVSSCLQQFQYFTVGVVIVGLHQDIATDNADARNEWNHGATGGTYILAGSGKHRNHLTFLCKLYSFADEQQ